MGTEVGGCLGRSSPREPVEECVGLGTPLPCGEGSRNVAGGIGAGDKRAKVLPASRAFLSLPSSGEPGGGAGGRKSCLGWRCRACPALTLGKKKLKAAPCSLHPQTGGTEDLPGVEGPEATGRAGSPSPEQRGTATCVQPSFH